jgi:SAM-dependent methyltransferase
MDDLARFNQERWEALAQADVAYARPWLDLDREIARQRVDPESMLTQIAGKDVLLLAGGGGQQSVAFALLGARVTVLDLTETQLARDRETAAHYGVTVTTLQGDMRDLSRFAASSFDIIWHAHSINFVPDAVAVFREVARVLRPGGYYRVSWSNPFYKSLDHSDWNGRGYVLTGIYEDGEMFFPDPNWEFERGDGSVVSVEGPREFRHTLSTFVNGLVGLGFVILGIWEEARGSPAAEPSSWDHFLAVAPPYLAMWAMLRPDVLPRR